MSSQFARLPGLVLAVSFVISLGLISIPAVGQAATEQACNTSSGELRTLSGTVSDKSGARVAGATVTAECGSVHEQVQTRADGSYALRLPPGRYQLRIEAVRFAPLSQQVSLAFQTTQTEQNFVLNIAQVRSSVTVSAAPGYAVIDSDAGTKTDTPLLEVPQAITVVKRRLLDEQGALKIDDALKNVAGVMPGGYYDGWDYYRIRGFDASFNTYQDGLRGGNGMAEEPFGLESVEVLKGPSSALYGQSVLGGIVNLQSKRPVPGAFAKLQFTGGSFGFYNPAIDVGSSLNASHSLYARLTALYQVDNSFVNYTYRNRSYVAPALTWELGPATTLTFLGRLQRDHGRLGFPLPATGTVRPNPNGEIPIDLFVGELGHNNHGAENDEQFGYQLTHQFNDSISLHQHMRMTWYRDNWNHLFYPGFLGEDDRTLYRYPLDWTNVRNQYALDNNMEASFKTGAIQHHALVGVDYYREPNSFHGESVDFSDLSQYVPIDLFNPVYGASPFPEVHRYTEGKSITQFTGFYLQDQAKLLRRLTLTMGGRFDLASNRDEPGPGHPDNAFTPRVGLTYQLVPGAALYASFSKSFLPQTGRIFDGSGDGAFAPPEYGQQWEGGIKTAFLGGRASSTLALYRLTRRNVVTTDPVHPNFYLLTGEQSSHGVELETSIQVLSGWNLTAAYTFTDAEVTKDNDIPIGTPTQNVPRNSFNAWTTYEFRRGWARGVTLGFGGRYYTDQSGDLLNTFQIPAYGLVDASVGYRRDHLYWQLNAYNLASERYFTGSYDELYVKPGEPRAIRTTIGWAF